MTKKKINNINDFDALDPDEQNEVLEEIRSKLGDETIKMDMYVPKQIKDWWEKKAKEDPGGRLAIEMLMSNFLIASLSIAINEGEQAFTQKTAIAQLVLARPMTVKDGKIYLNVGAEYEGEGCDCDECTCDKDNIGGGDGEGQTFH
jgi:hypothetical protein